MLLSGGRARELEQPTQGPLLLAPSTHACAQSNISVLKCTLLDSEPRSNADLQDSAACSLSTLPFNPSLNDSRHVMCWASQQCWLHSRGQSAGGCCVLIAAAGCRTVRREVKPACLRQPLTALGLGLVLDGVVGRAALDEVLTAAGWLHVLYAHVQALGDDAVAHLQARGGRVCVRGEPVRRWRDTERGQEGQNRQTWLAWAPLGTDDAPAC